MNYILPICETMWRVVLRGLIEMLRPDRNPEGRQEVLQIYLDEVLKGGKMTWKDDDDKRVPTSPIDIIKEALRLHPPTRHIHRRHPNGKNVVVDIEKCHHSELLAPGDPVEFRSKRWRQLRAHSGAQGVKRTEEALGFMAFGLVCPSDTREVKGFGMKTIAALVGVLCCELKYGWDLEPLIHLARPSFTTENHLDLSQWLEFKSYITSHQLVNFIVLIRILIYIVELQWLSSLVDGDASLSTFVVVKMPSVATK
jgi:hypothetical protein